MIQSRMNEKSIHYFSSESHLRLPLYCCTSGQVILLMQMSRLQVMLIEFEANEQPQKCQSHRSPQSMKGLSAGLAC